MDTKQNRGGIIFGAILITVGILLVLGQLVDFFNWGAFWPFIVIGIGAAFFAGMVLGGKSTGPLAIPGSIIGGIGLILLVQSATGLWATWSYAWALILVFVGIGIAIYGYWSDRPGARKSGWDLIQVGIILFLVFGALFEVLFSFFGITGKEGRVVWAILLTAVGLVQFLWRAFRLVSDPEKVSGSGRDLFGPLFLAGIGALISLSFLGWLPISKLVGFLSLWPLLLVAAGIQMIIGRRTPWVGAFLALLLIAAIFTIAFAGEQLGINLTAPNLSFTLDSNAWGTNERIRGDGEMGEASPQVSNFNAVSLEIPGTLEIVQGNTESLVIKAEENLLEYIETEVRGRDLEIDVRRGYSLIPSETITFLLTVKDLEEISISAAGEVFIDSLETDELSLNSSGVGSFKIDDLQTGKLDLRISGTGTVNVAGEAEEVNIRISGAGNFNGDDLKTQNTEVRISGLGNAALWVESNLDISISGAGSVSYYGSPSVNQNISGAGNAKRLGDK